MGMRYPGPVSRHNLVDLLLLWYHVPVRDCLFAMTVVVLPLVGTGPQDLAQWGVSRSGRESVTGWVLSECRWSTRMGVRGHGFCGVGPCATSAECINISIAESTVKDTLESRSHHGSTFNKSCTLSMNFALLLVVGRPSCCWRPILVVVVIAGKITRYS